METRTSARYKTDCITGRDEEFELTLDEHIKTTFSSNNNTSLVRFYLHSTKSQQLSHILSKLTVLLETHCSEL